MLDRMKMSELRRAMQSKSVASFDDLAKLLGRRPRLPTLPAQRSLAAYLGKLASGDDTWFRNRPAVLEALCEILEVTKEDLLRRPELSPIDWVFADFPQLDPLDLRSESPCMLVNARASTGQLLGVELSALNSQQPVSAQWVVAAPGSGARLFAHWLAATGNGTVISIRHLSEALGRNELTTNQGRLFLLVDESDAVKDREAAKALSRYQGLTVVASFVHPSMQQETQQSASSQMSAQQQSVVRDGWRIHKWTLDAGWRATFAHWIAERLREQECLFDPDQLLTWLDKMDPSRVRFPTPGDLMPVCALLSEHGPHWLRKQTPQSLGERLLGAVTDRFPADRDGQLWLTADSYDVVRKMLQWRLSALQYPLRGGLTLDAWLLGFPSKNTQHRLSEQEIDSALSRIRRKKGSAKRKEEAALRLRVTAPDPRESLLLLKQAGVLQTDENGGLSLRPRLTYEQLLMSCAADAIRTKEPQLWGRWCAEPQRRDVLDRALDDLTEQELLDCIHQAVSAFQSGDMGLVGAVEALFAAVGRRLQDSPSFQHTARDAIDQLQALWSVTDRIRRQRLPGPDALRVPITRVDGYWERWNEFVAACWSWSFFGPKPAETPKQDPPWLWPGWNQVSLADLEQLSLVGNEPSQAWMQHRRCESSDDRLAALVPRFLTSCVVASIPESYHHWPLPFVLLHAVDNDWPIGLWASDMPLQSWQCQVLLQGIASFSDAKRQHLATLVARVSKTRSSSLFDSWRTYAERSPDFYTFLLRCADWTAVCDSLTEPDLQSLLRYLGMLPPPVIDRTIQMVVKSETLTVDQILRSALDNSPQQGTWSVKERLLTELALYRAEKSWMLPRNFYTHCPTHALETASKLWKDRSDKESLQYWFTEAPRSISIRGPLIDLLTELPPQGRPSWAVGFLLSTLHFAAARTEQVFRMAQGLE